MIPRTRLGTKGPNVPVICFGTLTMSRSQADLSFEEGGKLLSYASSKGLYFWDTAEIYETYGHIKEGIRRSEKLPVISTKSYAWDKQGARASLEKALKETGLERIDVFMLHEQPSVLTLLGHGEALKYYVSQRDKGRIGQVGISTHAVEAVQAIAMSRKAIDPKEVYPRVREFDLGLLREVDMVHPILNIKGLGICDGDISGMEHAVRSVRSAGVGVLGMKLFGGGNLLNDFGSAVDYALGSDLADSFAIGMQSISEIDMNIRLFSGNRPTEKDIESVKSKKRRLVIEDWCEGCGECVKRCKTGALKIESGKAVVDPEKCVLCSYCAYACPEFAIKVV